MMVVIPNDKETYKEYIQRILNIRGNKKDYQNYQERHHIIPKCLGGSDDFDNLIYLYAQEHYYAHKLLAIENKSNINLQYAWWNMCQCTQNGQRVYHVSADDYALARENFSNNMKNNQYAKGLKMSEDTRKKMSDSHKGKMVGKNNPMYGKHCSEHCKELLRNKLSGEKNPSAKKVKCLETDEIFDTVKEAANWCNIGHSDIAAYIRGKQKSAGKHPITNEKLHWEYVE